MFQEELYGCGLKTNSLSDTNRTEKNPLSQRIIYSYSHVIFAIRCGRLSHKGA